MDFGFGPKMMRSSTMYMFKRLYFGLNSQVKVLKTRKRLVYAAQDALFHATS